MPTAAGYADLYDLPRPVREVLESELSTGERLLWADQPSASRSLIQTLPVLFFGIPWTAFAVFWTVMAASGLWTSMGDGAPLGFKILFPLWGLPFIAIGVAMLSAPYWARRTAQRTVYAITDKRVLIVSGGKTRAVRAYVPRRSVDLQRTQRADGSGDLVFLQDSDLRNMTNGGQQGLQGGTLLLPMFVGIPNVHAVENLLRETFLSNESEAAGAGVPAYGVGGLPFEHQVSGVGGVPPASAGKTSPHWWTSGER